MPLYCPDNSGMLSGCYRKQCPDVTEICNISRLELLVLSKLSLLEFILKAQKKKLMGKNYPAS